MKYFIDTEFIDDDETRTVDLISIGIVCEDGRELYLVSNEFDEAKCDDWLKDNVLKQLPPTHEPDGNGKPFRPSTVWRSRKEIREQVEAFIKPTDEPIEIWAYFASYDWLVFCQLWGRMLDLPAHFPKFVRDLKTYALDLGFTGKFKSLVPDNGHHDALMDARWNRDVYQMLKHYRSRAEQILERILSARMAFSFDPGGPNTPLEGWYVIENWIKGYFAGTYYGDGRTR